MKASESVWIRKELHWSILFQFKRSFMVQWELAVSH